MEDINTFEWHVTFLLKGVLEGYHIRDTHYIFAHPTQDVFQLLEETAVKLPELKKFICNLTRPDQLTFACFSIIAKDEKEAFIRSHRALKGIIDGYGILAELIAPVVSDVVIFRLNRSEDVLLRVARDFGMAHWADPAGEAQIERKAYRDALFTQLMPIMDLLAQTDAKLSLLEEQIRYSSATFRRSIMPRFTGLEFLGKFAAMEGLVCGDIRKDKKKLLTTRLAALFKHDPTITKKIESLWEQRSTAIHQARLYYDSDSPTGQSLGLELDTLHYLFVGVLCFANQARGECESIDTLWETVSNYQLPDCAKTPDPHHKSRGMIASWVEKRGGTWKGAGTYSDSYFPVPTSDGIKL